MWATKKKTYKIKPFRNFVSTRARRMKRMFLRKSIGSKGTYYYKRNVLRTAIVQTAGADNLGAMTFRLSDLPSSAEFTALYDSYKIGKVVVRFIPQQNVQDLTNPTTTVVPKLFTVIDTDDATAAVNINELREYETVKVSRGLKPHKRVFKPMVAMALYGNGFFTSYGNKSNAWINTSSPNVDHYGLKYAIDAGVVSQTNLQKWDIECTYYVQFRSVK